jgi:hypothetical protein
VLCDNICWWIGEGDIRTWIRSADGLEKEIFTCGLDMLMDLLMVIIKVSRLELLHKYIVLILSCMQ